MRWKDTAQGRAHSKERRKWASTGNRKTTTTLFMPAISAHGSLLKALEQRNIQLSPAEMAGIETEALVRTLRAFRSGLVGILAGRYAKKASHFEKFISVRNPKGSRALHTYKTKGRGTVYKRIVWGEVKVRGPRRTHLAEWNPRPGRHGLTFRILRSGGEREIAGSFLVHGFWGMKRSEGGGYERVKGAGDKWFYGTYVRTGRFYVNKRGWLREGIAPLTTTSGLEVLGDRGAERQAVQRLTADVSTFLEHATLNGLDRMLMRRAKGKA